MVSSQACKDRFSDEQGNRYDCNLRSGHYGMNDLHALWSEVERGKWRLDRIQSGGAQPAPVFRDRPPSEPPYPEPILGMTQ